MRWCWLVAVVAAVAACAQSMHKGDGAQPTLEVHNAGPAAVDLHAVLGVSVAGDTIGFYLGTVYAGGTECFRFLATATPQWLKIRSSDGTFHTSSFYPATRPAWRLELRGHPQTDRLALEPADEKCKPGQRSSTR